MYKYRFAWKIKCILLDFLSIKSIKWNKLHPLFQALTHSNIKRADFSVVDSSGETACIGALGLLMTNGGTVCDDNFSTHSADAICRKMGYDGHIHWTYGMKWSIQSDFDIKLDDVHCSSPNWSSCSFIFSHNCQHSEDVFLQCSGPSEWTYYWSNYLWALSRKFLLCHKLHDFKNSFYIAFGLNKTAEKRRNKQFVQNKCRSKRLFGFLKSENLRTVRSHFLCFWRLSHNFKSREIDITPMFAMSINR